jgi:PAS domain S-box-containing protein
MAQTITSPAKGGIRPGTSHVLSSQIGLILDGSGVGLWDWNILTGRCTHSRVNKRLLGFDDSEEIGDSYDELTSRIHPDDVQDTRARVERHLRDETPFYQAEFRVRRKDGTYAWFESRGVVVERGPHGEPLRMAGMHVDISDRKANEQLRRDLEGALRRNQDELQSLVQLQTRRLIEAADAAEQGNRARNLLMANVGEELRSPLKVVLESVARMLDGTLGELSPGMREQLELIQRAGHDLSDNVNRLLDVCSIESNTLEICATPVDLRRVLEEQCEAMQARATERGVDLRAPSCGEDIIVFADRARLAQVVRELLSNAIRFTERGHVQVRARVIESTAFVDVQDTGIGIPPDRQATLFHAFQSTTDQPRLLRQGLGLGLSISRALIDAMAGTIGVTSKPGRGSRFWFTLPLAASAQKTSATRH